MISRISIENLRCFEKLEIDNMAPYTLISGRNNSGKSTILEAIFLLLGAHGKDVFNRLNSFRGEEQAVVVKDRIVVSNVSQQDVWKYFFHNVDTNRNISVQINYDDNEYSLLAKQVNIETSDLQRVKNIHYENITSCEQHGLEIVIKNKKLNEENVYCFGMPNDISNKEKKSFSMPAAMYMGENAYLSRNVLAGYLGQIKLQERMNELLEKIRYLFEDVEEILDINDNGKILLYVRLKNNVVVPDYAMGSGFLKILSCLLPMLSKTANIYLIDEIEVSLHHLQYGKFWEVLTTTAKDTDSQIIATTQSYEMIKSAYNWMNISELNEKFAYFRIGKDRNDVYKSFHFNDNNLCYAFKNAMEIR